MRTEKSPLRIACSACSNSWEGSGFPFVYGLALERRRADGVAEPRSVMGVPSAKVRHAQAHPSRHVFARSNRAKGRDASKIHRNDRMLAGSISAKQNQFREGTLVPTARANFLIFIDGSFRTDHHVAFMTASGN